MSKQTILLMSIIQNNLNTLAYINKLFLMVSISAVLPTKTLPSLVSINPYIP